MNIPLLKSGYHVKQKYVFTVAESFKGTTRRQRSTKELHRRDTPIHCGELPTVTRSQIPESPGRHQIITYTYNYNDIIILCYFQSVINLFGHVLTIYLYHYQRLKLYWFDVD